MIEYVRDGAVVRISLDDGGRNVLTPKSVASLRSIIADAEASNEVQAIILSGNNHALSVGLAVPEATLQLLRDRLLPGQQFACAGLSKLYDYQQASEIGFLDHLVPCSSDAQALAAREAARLGALPEEAYLETKLSLRNRYAQLVNFSNH